MEVVALRESKWSQIKQLVKLKTVVGMMGSELSVKQFVVTVEHWTILVHLRNEEYCQWPLTKTLPYGGDGLCY